MAGLPQARDDVAAAAPAQRAESRLRRFLTNPYLTLVSRLVLGGVMLLGGLTKLGTPESFAVTIRSYEVPLPDFVVQAMAVGLPPLEIGLGVWLWIGLFTRITATITTGLLAVFMVALAQAWARGVEADCGCFSGGPQGNPLGLAILDAMGPVGVFLTTGQVGFATMARDSAFLLFGVHLMLVPTIFALDNWRQARIEAAEREYEEALRQEEEDLLEEEQVPAEELELEQEAARPRR